MLSMARRDEEAASGALAIETRKAECTAAPPRAVRAVGCRSRGIERRRASVSSSGRRRNPAYCF